MSASASVSRPAAMASVTQVIPVGIDLCQERLQKVAQKIFEQIPPPGEHPEFNCPITKTVLKDPRILPCGHTFDFEAVSRWLAQNPTCPVCRKPIPQNTELPSNLALKALIKEWENQERVPSLSHCASENPSLAKKHLNIAHSYLEMDKYEEALRSFSEAFNHTKRSEDYIQVPVLYEKLKETNKAVLAYLYQAIYELNEGKAWKALCSFEHILPIIHMKPGFPFKAACVSLELLQSQPNGIAIIGWFTVTILGKNKEEAIDIYKQLIAYDPDYLFKAYQQIEPLLEDPEEKIAIILQAAEVAERSGNLELATYFHQKAKAAYIISVEQWASAARLAFPPYSEELKKFLAEPCPIFKDGRTRAETHIVVPLFPRVFVDDEEQPMTLMSFNLLNKRSGRPAYTPHCFTLDLSAPAEEEFHWAVMTKGVLPESLEKSYKEQVHLLPAGYEVPGAFDVLRALLWEYRRSGTYCFGEYGFTRCKEESKSPWGNSRVVVGSSIEDLKIESYPESAIRSIGLVGFRKF